MELDSTWAQDWVRRSAQAMTQQRNELIDLDRAIGDGDHGENLDRGFAAAVAQLDAVAETDDAPHTVADVLRITAAALMRHVGGAAGPLLGTGLLRAAREAEAQNDVIDSHGIARILDAAAQGISARGRAVVGDKTMVDVWVPAAQAAHRAADEGGCPGQVLAAAAQAARSGAKDTEAMVAKRGRASFLGEDSRDHRDPGAQSSALMLLCAAQAAAAMHAAQDHEAPCAALTHEALSSLPDLGDLS
ncbi:dihydroxyacetone kinase subunit DhaL [Actinomyces vulturis]|uniref:dihydroxyacetone kinase subunit DhaL n=1 Tax=Actinomyces vulturis TaxID=1857645 RepID=UPI00082D4781|nr:dihydroxyacetone kinase subunit DhaL [Actinomyces vulturis]